MRRRAPVLLKSGKHHVGNLGSLSKRHAGLDHARIERSSNNQYVVASAGASSRATKSIRQPTMISDV
jgi:hypothetical protein